MDFRKLSYFEAVCRLKSFTKASEELHVTQPSVTMAVHSLEEDMGVLLLNRNRGTLVPTPEGEFLFEKAKHLIKELENVELEMKDFISDRTENLRIGYSIQMRAAIQPVLEEFRQKHRGIHVIENESSTPSIVTQLKDGMIDLGIIAVTGGMVKSLEIHPLFQGELRVCLSRRNPLSSRETITLDEFERQPLISLSLDEPKNSYIFRILQDTFPERKIKIKPQFSALLLNSYFQHIRCNDGIGLTYHDIWFSAGQYEKELGDSSTYKEISFNPPCFYTVAAVYPKGRRLAGAAKTCLEYLDGCLQARIN